MNNRCEEKRILNEKIIKESFMYAINLSHSAIMGINATHVLLLLEEKEGLKGIQKANKLAQKAVKKIEKSLKIYNDNKREYYD
jgi:hypothetical protein